MRLLLIFICMFCLMGFSLPSAVLHFYIYASDAQLQNIITETSSNVTQVTDKHYHWKLPTCHKSLTNIIIENDRRVTSHWRILSLKTTDVSQVTDEHYRRKPPTWFHYHRKLPMCHKSLIIIITENHDVTQVTDEHHHRKPPTATK